MTRTLMASLRWVEQGTELFHQQVASLSEEQWDAPTRLDGWTPKHLVAHVGANALALCNLLHWASTGEETPMYSSPEQRAADIEAGSRKGSTELAQYDADASKQLARGLAAMDEESWQHQVRTAQGRTVPASEVPWMRSREVMVHSCDLAGSTDLAGLPIEFLQELGAEIVAKRSGAGKDPALRLQATDGDTVWDVVGDGEPTTLRGTTGQLVAYLAGRPASLTTQDGNQPPNLTPWL